jgi:small subunit ribosomal protein S9
MADTNAPQITNPNFSGAAAAAGGAPMITLTDSQPPEPGVRPVRKQAESKHGWWSGTGRRKTSVARVRIRPAQGGEGKVIVALVGDKTKTIEQYFSEERDRNDAYAPLKATGTLGKLDVIIRCSGGGYMGQAGAVMLGVARALRAYDPSVEGILRDNGMLTRDSRDVERKKYGQSGARRRFQFSKR